MTNPLSIRRLMLGGIAAAAVAVPFIALADEAHVVPVARVYPALRQDGMSFAVTAGSDGRIAGCEAIETPGSAATERACAALTARGIPAGIEPARAIGDQAKWLTIDDVPENLMMTNTHAAAQIVFEVDASGKVSACRPSRTTGMAEFDALACKLFQQRARFTPATYKGAPVPAVGTTSTRFDSD